MPEQRYDFVKDILVRYRETKKIYGYEDAEGIGIILQL